MRKWLIFLIVCMSCSSKEETPQQSVAVEAPEQEEWIVYEGVVRSEAGNDIKIQLSLLQNSVGMESEYKTEEELIVSKYEGLLTHRWGKYSILYGSGSNVLITLNESIGKSLGGEPGKGYALSPQAPEAEILEKGKIGRLTFKSGRNSDELILVDEDSNPVAEDGRYTLKKRSILFTVEGFVTFEPNSTDFFEFNTRDDWNVAKAGSYGEVQEKYTELATEKHEGIYLKAIAFYVEDVDSTGVNVRNLVIKKVIAMKPHQEFMASR